MAIHTDGAMVYRKDYAFELKSTSDDGPGTFEGVMSAPVLDRDNEIIDSLAFAPLPAHITIDIDHGLTVEKTVGSGEPYYDTDGLLKVKGSFASTPLGQVTRTLVKEGHIRHMSVAFRGAVRELDEQSGITHIRKGELINCTITGIPANVATAISAKVGARNSMKDAERIQTMHDYAIELGATCEAKHAHNVVLYASDGNATATTSSKIVVAQDDTKPVAYQHLIVSGRRAQLAAAAYKESTDTDTPPAAAEEAAPAGATVEVARALVALALAEAELVL